MVKLIGIFLILTSVVTLLASAFIHMTYSDDVQVTGNVISNIIQQPYVELGFSDYLQGIMLSYSAISLIVGLVFLVRF